MLDNVRSVAIAQHIDSCSESVPENGPPYKQNFWFKETKLANEMGKRRNKIILELNNLIFALLYPFRKLCMYTTMSAG